MLIRCLLVLVLTGSLPAFSAGLPKKIEIGKNADLTVAGNNTVIVVDPSASKVTKFAAKELQEFLSQILGRKIPVSAWPGKGVNLYVGLGDFARKKGLKGEDLARDGFFIKRYGRDICIAGRDDAKADPEKLLKTSGVWGMMHERASAFAVYDFLERFAGVRFYFPGELGTIVPKKAALKLPEIDIVEKPDFIKRTYSAFWDGEYFEGENRKATVNPRKNLNLYRRRASTTGEPPCTHGLENGFNLTARFYKSHPEYFALTRTGERNPLHLCWNSPVMEEIYQDIKAYLTGRPASERGVGPKNTRKPSWHFAHFMGKYVDIFPADGMVLCECPKCRAAYQPERGRLFAIATELVWNNVINWAERLKKENIDGTLCMPAYVPYKDLPKRKIPDNVLVMVCDIGPWAMDTEAGRKGLALTKAWMEKSGRKVQLWNYAYKGVGRWKMTGIPAYTPKAVGKYYRAAAPYACGAFLQSESDRFLYFYMNHYIFCKVAWDNQADYEAMLAEHYQLMFGPAAQIMREIMEDFEAICTKQIVGRIIDTPLGPTASVPSDTEIWNKIYSPRKMADFTKRFAQASKLVKPGSLEAGRIELFRREYLDPLLTESARFLNYTKAARGLRFDMRYPIRMVPYKFDPKKRPELVNTSIIAKYTNDALVFTIDCEEPKMDDVRVEKRSADDPDAHLDNCVEIMLNPCGDRKNYYQWVITSNGVLTDYRWKRIGKTGSQPESKWNSGARVKVSKTPDGWRAELSIPLKSLPGLKKSGFPVNFGRSRVLKNSKKHHQLYVWSSYVDGFHDIDNFGIMTPGDKEIVIDGGFDHLKPAGQIGRCLSWGERRNGKFIGWLAWGTDPIICDRDDKVFFSAPYSMKLTSDSGKMLSLSQRFTERNLKRNTKYRISFMLKMDHVKPVKPGGGVALNLVDCRNNFFPTGSWSAGTSDWTRMSFDFKTADKPLRNDGSVEIKLLSCTGTVWVDNISVEEIAE